MKKLKFNLKEILADVEQDNTAAKPIHQLISQEAITEMLKHNPGPKTAPAQPEKK